MRRGPAVVLVSGPDPETLRSLARTLVEERLVACATLVPGARSIYRWQGAIEEQDECLAILKTVSSRVSALATRIAELHPYEVPEVLALAVDEGAAPYLAWLEASTGG